MGCNTSSEAKTEEKNTQENQENSNAEEGKRACGSQVSMITAAHELLQHPRTHKSVAGLLDGKEKQKESAEESKSEADAATKIQAAFRGHKTRKSISMKAVNKPQEPEPEPTKAELEAEFRADDKELCSAATKIQASFRGHQARKTQTVVEKTQEQQDKEDIEKIDLGDPDLNKAATKIQASFRGHKVRKDTN